ncbi:MAG: thioredoxin domain-containing protein [Candidatus Sumerlaeaceae bacterium]
MRAPWFILSAAGCLLLGGCSEGVEKNSRKVEGQSQAMQTPGTAAPYNADDEGKATKSDSSTSPELTLQPSNPVKSSAAGGAAANSTDTTSAPAAGSSDKVTTQSAGALSAPSDSAVALGGGNEPAPGGMNAPAEQPADFAQSPSPYLRAASKSEIRWQPFTASTFAAAATSNKPVLIDIGANWNHQCRIMAAETYKSADVVQALNDQFVCVKVDADLQPDVAQRYMAAYRLINQNRETEYPLTVFALPDGRPFDILSFVPAQAQSEQAGMSDLLKQVQELFSGQSAQVQKQAELIERKLARPAPAKATAAVDVSAIRQAVVTMAKSPDGSLTENGPAVATTLLQLYSDSGDKAQMEQASKILLDQFRSPLRDQVLGGYFNAGVTDRAPRFEKLLPVQSSLLSANLLAYAASRKTLHKEAAEEILRFCRDTLEIQGGGFYASQDADSASNDNGAYFTWTRDEIFQLTGDTAEARMFAHYLNAGEQKAPLYVTQKLQLAADANGLSYEQALKALQELRLKLRESRMQQENVPFVNKAVYASWNADAIIGYLDAFKYLGDTAARDFALQTADFIINNMVSPKQGVSHVFHKGQASEYGLLDDNAKFAAALMQCFEVSGQREYMESAESIMSFVERRFLDPEWGLYTDRAPSLTGAAGLQKVALCPTEDVLSASPNAAAAQAWYALYQATSKDEYREKAERIVQGGIARGALESLRGASFSRVAALVATGAPKVLIIATADDPTAQEMHQAALPVFRMGKLVERMTPEEAAKTDYPPAKDGGAIAYVCTAKNCAPPVREASKVADLVKTFGRQEAAKAPATEVAAPAAETSKPVAPEPAAQKQTM